MHVIKGSFLHFFLLFLDNTKTEGQFYLHANVNARET